MEKINRQVHQHKYTKIKECDYQYKDDTKSTDGDLYYYDSSQVTFSNLNPPRSMPQSFKKITKNIQRIASSRDNTDLQLQPAMSARRFKNAYCHKTYDPQVRWSRDNIAVTMERFQPMTSRLSPTSHLDYSYAYYEPGSIMCHSNIPTSEESTGHSVSSSPNVFNTVPSKTKENLNKSEANDRHTYMTHYGTHENIYEDISVGKYLNSASSTQSLNNDNNPHSAKMEFQRILNNHYRVLEELNLSVEELLMPTTKPNILSSRKIIKHTTKSCVKTLNTKLWPQNIKGDLLSSVNDVGGGEDSGFSGSSSGATYIGSLRNYKTAITRSLRVRSSGMNGSIGSDKNEKVQNQLREGLFCTKNRMDNKTVTEATRKKKFPFWNNGA